MAPTTKPSPFGASADERHDERVKSKTNANESTSARLRWKHTEFVMCKISIMLVLITLSAFLSPVSAFNLEPRIPVVKRGTEGSYFGYSVAMHQSVDPITNADLDSWCVLSKLFCWEICRTNSTEDVLM